MFCDVDDWILHSVSLCLYSFSVYYLCHFVTVCTVKKMWAGGYVTVIFHMLSIRNTAFRQTWARKKGTENLAKHLLRRDSDSQKKLDGLHQQIFFVLDTSHLQWQVPLDKTSQLDKLTLQVDLSPCPLTHLQFAWQVITCQVDLSSHLEQSSSRKCRTLQDLGTSTF